MSTEEIEYLEFKDAKNKGELLYVDRMLIRGWFGMKDTGDTALLTSYGGGIVVRESIKEVKKIVDAARKKAGQVRKKSKPSTAKKR